MSTAPTDKKTPAKAIFISDIHLSEAHPKTTEAFLEFLEKTARQSEKLYILGDLFEYWIGDDDIANPYNQRIVNAIRQCADAGVSIYWTPGNRDFLTGRKFARETGATYLPDLHKITIENQTILISHGDAECLDDPDYIRFRARMRNRWRQRLFLLLPLKKRRNIVENMRKDSRKINETKPRQLQNITTSAIETILDKTGADIFIHGHIHQKAIYEHGSRKRYSLPDWDLDSENKRGGWLELEAGGNFEFHFPVI